MNVCYHLRVTAKWNDICKGVIRDFLTKWEPTIYIFSEEVSEKGVVHIHGHLEYTEAPAKSSLSDLFKRYKLSGMYYHKQLVKDKQNNLLYVCKDLNIKDHNLEQYVLDDIISKTQEINEDKKKDTRHKLLDLYQQWFNDNKEQCIVHTTDEISLTSHYTFKVTEFDTYFNDLDNIAMFINDLYVNNWDKEPPLAHMSGYVLYIATKINIFYGKILYDTKKFYSSKFR